MLPIRRTVARAAAWVAGPVQGQAYISLATRAFVAIAVQQSTPVMCGSVLLQKRSFSQSPIARDETAALGREPPAETTGPVLSDSEFRASERKRSVFVVNVPVDTKEDEIREIFNEYAPVEGLTKGPGGLHWFVFFKDEETANRIIEETNGLFVRGRQMRVAPRFGIVPEARVQDARRAHRGGHLGSPTATLFIGNMPYNMTDQDLNSLSKKLEYCFDIRVAVDRHTGWPRGYAHVDFYTVGLAQRALKKALAADTMMGPNMLRFDFAQGSRGGSTTFTLSRLRALKLAGKTIEDFEELTEELRRKEGSWDV